MLREKKEIEDWLKLMNISEYNLEDDNSDGYSEC
jgi:hypothetical protein